MKFFARILMPSLLMIYIAAESWMKLQHSSLCSATGCKLAASLLNFDAIYLDYLGFVAAMSILITGILSLRSAIFELLFYIVLYTAIAFESVMIAYQFFANPEICLFCLGVYAMLLLTALLSERRYFMMALPAIIALFAAMSTLSIPKNDALVKGDGIYLIHSPKCPHCRRVKEYFSKEHIRYRAIGISDPNARSMTSTLGIGEIPIALVVKGEKIEILRGERAIMERFESGAEAAEEEATQSVDIYANPQEEGCSISPLQSSSCSEGDGN